MRRRPVLAALALVAVTAAGCSTPPSSRVSGEPGPVQDTVSPAASASPSDPPDARSLVLPQTVRAELASAWTGAQGLKPGDVKGLRPGAYYGYVPATRTFWALVDFVPADASPDSKVAVKIQDGPWVLSRRQGQRWRLVGDTGGLVCPPSVPAVMLAAWAIATDAC